MADHPDEARDPNCLILLKQNHISSSMLLPCLVMQSYLQNATVTIISFHVILSCPIAFVLEHKQIFSFSLLLEIMTRAKVKLQFITNDSARKATFKKRKKGLLKKVHELSTLCGIEACAIVYGSGDTQPEVWPSPHAVHRIIAKFERMPEMEQNKKMLNQESFLRQRLLKLNEQLYKQVRDNREKEVTEFMFRSLMGRSLDGLNLVDLNDLGWIIEQHKKEIQLRLDRINNVGPSHTDAAAGEEAVTAQEVTGYDVSVDPQKPIWFREMMNPHHQMGFAGREAMLPLGGNSLTSPWLNVPFP